MKYPHSMFSVTELCDADMSTWARGKPWAAIVDRIVEAGRGLEALHRAGFIHGDVKPGNILVRDGVAKVADFGMATKPGPSMRVGGTAGFIAPEVADGLRTEAGDVFALAASTWACLFGRSAFGVPPEAEDRAAATMALVARARDGAIEPPPRSSAVPRRVIAAVRWGLEPNPLYRPGLRVWLARLSAARQRAPRLRRLASAALVAGTLLMLGAGGHALYSAYAAHEQDHTTPEPVPQAEPEPAEAVMARVAELARRDDPLEAWTFYVSAKDEWVFESRPLLEVASRLLLDAELGLARNPGASAEVALRLANDARLYARHRGDWDLARDAREIATRSEAFIRNM